MPEGPLIQCFLFIPHTRATGATRNLRSAAAGSRISGFVLFPCAFRNKHPKICDLFLRSDIQIISNASAWPSLRSIVKESQVEIIEVLLDSSSVLSGPLRLSVNERNREIVKLLLGQGNPVRFKRKLNVSAICTITEEKDLTALGSVLKSAAEFSYYHPGGGTLLHLAAERGQEQLMKTLLSCGLDIHAERFDGWTPLFVAAEKGWTAISNLLIRKGASVTHKDKRGMTATHVAAGNGFPEIVTVLLQNGADVNAACDEGQTPIFSAGRNGHVRVLDDLFFFDADIFREDSNGRTLVDAVCEREDTEILHHFLEYLTFILFHESLAFPCDITAGWLCKFRSVLVTLRIHEQMRLRAIFLNYLDILYLIFTSRNLLSLKMLLDKKLEYGLPPDDFETELMTRYSNVQQENVRLRNEAVGNSCFTFHDILTKPLSGIACSARNDAIMQVLKSKDFPDKFPNLARLMSIRFQIGVRRRKLLNQAIQVCPLLLPHFRSLPIEIKEKIVTFLSNQDILILLNVCADSQRHDFN